VSPAIITFYSNHSLKWASLVLKYFFMAKSDFMAEGFWRKSCS
jgi:hypothetical protein